MKQVDKVEYVKTAKEYYSRVLQALTEMEQGQTEDAVVRKYQLERRHFRYLLFNPECNTEAFDGHRVFKDVWVITSEYECMYAYIRGARWCYPKQRADWQFVFDYGIRMPESETMPSDIDTRMQALFCQLDGLEQTIFRERAVERLSLSEIAEKHNTSKQNIQIIEQKVLDWFRHPVRLGELTKGKDFVEGQKAENQMLVKYMRERAKRKQIQEPKVDIKGIEGKSVDELDMRPRTSNALHRGGIHTVDQLVNTDGAILLTLKGFGITSLVDTERALQSYCGVGVKNIYTLPLKAHMAVKTVRTSI